MKKMIEKVQNLTMKKYWPVITFFLLAIVLILLNIKVIKVPYVMMEDGPVFLNGALTKGILSFTEKYGGYLYLLPRIIAFIAVSLGKLTNSAVVMLQISKFLSIFINLYIINYFNESVFDGIIKNRLIRFLVSILLLLFASDFLAILYCMVSLNWWAGIFVFFCSLEIILGKFPKGFNFILLLISLLTTPTAFCLVFALAIFFLSKRKEIKLKTALRKDRTTFIKMGTIFLFLLIQAYAILFLKGSGDVMSNTALTSTISDLIARIYLAIKLSFASVNFIFGVDTYRTLNSIGLAAPVATFFWMMLAYFFIKHKKCKYLLYATLSIFLIYFMFLYKESDYFTRYHQLMNEWHTIWYQVIPCLIVMIIFAMLFEIIRTNYHLSPYGLYGAMSIMVVFLVGTSIKNYNSPDLSYIDHVYKIESYVDFHSKRKACLSIPPRWVNWCVEIPVDKRYCEAYECIK